MDHLRSRARRERHRSRGGRVVHAADRAAIDGPVLYRHRYGRGLVQRHDEHEVVVLAVALPGRQVCDGDGRKHGGLRVDVVVDDGARGLPPGDRGSRGRRQRQGEGLAGLDEGIAQNVDAHRPGGLACPEGQHTDNRCIVLAGNGRTVAGRIADRDGSGRCLRERDGEDHLALAGIALGEGAVGDRHLRHDGRRSLGRIDQLLPFRARRGVAGGDVVIIQFGERHARQDVGLAVAFDADDRRTIDLLDREFAGLEPAEIERVLRRIEGDDGVDAILPVDDGRRSGLTGGRRPATRARRPVVRAGDRHALRLDLRIRNRTEAELQGDAILAGLGEIEDEVLHFQVGGRDTQQDQCLTRSRIGDDHSFGIVGHVDLFAGAEVAEVHRVGGGIEGDPVDLADLVGARIDGVVVRRDSVLPGERAGHAFAQMIVDDRHETVDRELTERNANDDRDLARPRIHDPDAGRGIDDDAVVHGDGAKIELVPGRIEPRDVRTVRRDLENSSGRACFVRHVLASGCLSATVSPPMGGHVRGDEQRPTEGSRRTRPINRRTSRRPAGSRARKERPMKKGRRMPALLHRNGRALLGGLDHDLDLEAGGGELGFDRRAGRGVAGRDPGVPHLVHLAPGRDVGQPDVGRQHLRLVGTGLGQELVDLVEDLLGLALHVGLGVVGGQAGEIDRVAMDHGAAHAGAGVDALDAHIVSPR